MQKQYKKNPNDIGAVWKRQAKSGITYLSGKITIDGKEHYIVLFKSKNYVEGGNRPYYNVLLSEQKPKQAEAQQAEAPAESQQETEVNVDDIPF